VSDDISETVQNWNTADTVQCGYRN